MTPGKNFITDMDGVLLRGNTPIPGAAEFIRALKDSDRQYLVLTNNPAYTPLDLAHRLRGRFGIQGDYLLFVSTIEPRKNVPFLLRAYRQLVDNYGVDARLVLAGEKGWLFDEVFDLTKRLNLEDRVLFLGRVSTKELLWLYNAAQALVAPSIYEGFGLTPLEAMACGTPAIVSDGGALPEVAGEAAEVVPQAAGAEGLAQALLALVSDRARRAEMSRRGIEHAARYTWAEHARIVSQVYREVCRAQV